MYHTVEAFAVFSLCHIAYLKCKESFLCMSYTINAFYFENPKRICNRFFWLLNPTQELLADVLLIQPRCQQIIAQMDAIERHYRSQWSPIEWWDFDSSVDVLCKVISWWYIFLTARSCLSVDCKGNVRWSGSVIWPVSLTSRLKPKDMPAVPVLPLVINGLLSALGCLATLKLIPAFKDHFISARLYGIDLNKTSKKEMWVTSQLLLSCRTWPHRVSVCLLQPGVPGCDQWDRLPHHPLLLHSCAFPELLCGKPV